MCQVCGGVHSLEMCPTFAQMKKDHHTRESERRRKDKEQRAARLEREKAAAAREKEGEE